MRSVAVVVALLLGFGVAFADANDKALKPYAGKLVISPDEPPRELGALPAFFKTYYAKDNHYEVWKGPPWELYLLSWQVKRAKEVTLVIVDKDDPKATPLMSVGYTLIANDRLLWAKVTADRSTGFAPGKTFVIRLLLGKKLLASSELRVRE